MNVVALRDTLIRLQPLSSTSQAQMSRFSRSIRDFFQPKQSNELDGELAPSQDFEANERGLSATIDNRKQSLANISTAPNKRRKLSPSPDILNAHVHHSDRYGVENHLSQSPQEAHIEGPPSASSSQLSSSEPSSSPDVLILDGTLGLEHQANSQTRTTAAQRSDSPSKTTAHSHPPSSLTTLPRSTQSSGSRRIVKNGEEMVMDSQSSEESDDLVDLLELFTDRRETTSAFVTPAARPRSTSPPPRQTSNAYSGASSRSSEKLRASTRSTASSTIPKPPERKYKFSLNNIVKRSEKAAKAQSEAQQHVNELEEQEKAWVKPESDDTVDEKYLASVVEHGSEEEGKAKRVLQAILRTDARDQILVWHFFDKQASTVPRRPFPHFIDPLEGWMKLLEDPNRRQRLFATGFVSRMASSGYSLRIEILEWLLSELCHEKRDELLDAYVEVIAASASELRTRLTTTNLQQLFEAAGARREAVESHAPIHAELTRSNVSHWIPEQLRWLIRCVQGLSRWLSQETRFYIVHVLMRMFLDESIRYDGEYQLLISESITILIRDIPDDEADITLSTIGHMLYEAVPSCVMRDRLVASLPCATPRTHLFRRRLALAFALETPSHIERPMSSQKLTDHVILHFIKSPLFRISPDTDYKVLTARFNMLDIAIDTGFSDFSWLQSSSEGSDEEANRKEKERKFNAGIDMLAQEVLEITARIVDSGLSSLRRTEAKAAAQRLQQRLEFAVRTKERPAKDWFGEKGDAVRREFMQTWFQKPEKANAEGEESFGGIDEH